MPSWKDILTEISATGSTYDVIRRKYIRQYSDLVERNVIVYYSGWLQKPTIPGLQINDADKNGFMNASHNLDRTKGLDLFLHTPGGEAAATESLVHYLHSLFGRDIRAVVPQLALSAGTMIACACKEILMGQHSSLGPIDPQMNGIPAYGIVEEFNRAYEEIKADSAKIPVWQPILARYRPTLVGECEKALKWSEEMVSGWLKTGMMKRRRNKATRVAEVVDKLSDHEEAKTHGRHFPIDFCRKIGLKIICLEDDKKLQDAVLSVHHACIHTLTSTNAFKIIENQLGTAFIQMAKLVKVGK